MVADHKGGEHQGGVNLGETMKAIRTFVAALSLLLSGNALAQTGYPEQAVRIIVGFPAGTAPDVAARVLADKFSQDWGKPVVVENITGAGGNIGTDRAAKSAPDGYTLFMGGNSSLIMSPRCSAETICCSSTRPPAVSIRRKR